MLSEFKKFILRGNVVDLAVGIVIGAAFGKIVSSLVADILMLPIGIRYADGQCRFQWTVLEPGQPLPNQIVRYRVIRLILPTARRLLRVHL